MKKEENKSQKHKYMTFIFIFFQCSFAIWLVFEGIINSFDNITMIWAGNSLQPILLDPVALFMMFTCTGALLGVSILNIISFHKYVAIEKNFDIDHVWGFLFSPLLALTIGAVTFGLLQAGLFVLNGNSSLKSTATIQYFGYIGFGAVAGYNWDAFINKIQNLSNNINKN